jgi:HK97 family phage major capsid protein
MELRDDHKQACQTIGVQFHRDGAIDVPLANGFPLGMPAWTLDGRQQKRDVESRADANMLKSANVGLETVPQGFGPELERTLLAFGGPRSVCRVWRTPTGNAVPWPTIDDTANSGALLAEEASIGDTLAAATAAVTFDAYKISSKPIKMSAELLQDEAVGLGTIVGSLLGERLGRAEGALTTTGSGSSTYKGIVTCSTLGKTAASATAIASDEILDLIHAVNPAYRSSGSVGFMLNDGILLYLRKLKDGDGQYLWQPGLSMGVPDRLAGYPLTINQHMQATVATGTKTVLFGDFSKFIIREVASIRFFRLDELYRATDQTGFVAFLRGDSDCIQTAAIKHLIQA